MTFQINMASSLLVFVCLCPLFFVNSEILQESTPSAPESYTSEVNAVLSYLNSSPYKIYNYKEASLINAHKKSNITELSVDVIVECLNQYPDVPCSNTTLRCSAFVQQTSEGVHQVLNTVNCSPLDERREEPQSTPQIAEASRARVIALSNEAVSSEVNEPFMAVRKDTAPCLGCPFDLNTNAEGVDELVGIALDHVGSERTNKQTLVKIHRLQQQVVSGVKYILLMEIANTLCPKGSPQDLSFCPVDMSNSYICEVTYIQKPWISREKHIISNNCTISQEFTRPDNKKNEISNEIDANGKFNKPESTSTNFDQIAETGTVEEMSPSRLSDLESQILGMDDFIQTSNLQQRPVYTSSASSESTSSSEETTPLVQEITTFLQNSDESDSSEETLKREKRSDRSKEIPTEDLNRENVTESEEARIDSHERFRSKRAIPQLEKISPEEKGLVKNLADFAAAASDKIDDDNHKRVVLQILGAKKMIGDDGVYYHLIMRLGISRCLEDKAYPFEDCREKLFENYTKICKVLVFVDEDYANPKVMKSQCQNIKKDQNDSNRTNYSRFRRQITFGGESDIDKNSNKIKKLASKGIQHFNVQSGQQYKSKPIEIVSATSQVVAGISYKIKVKIADTECTKNDHKDLEDCKVKDESTPKECTIKVWEKSWENFIQFTISCKGDEKEYKVQTTINRRKRDTLGLPGGELEVQNTDESIVKYLEDALTRLDEKSAHENKYKIHKVIKATNQVVAGFIYRIDAEIVVSDCKKSESKKREECGVLGSASPKKCKFVVFGQPWVANSRSTNVTCGEDEHFFTNLSVRRKRETIKGGEYQVPVDNEYVVKYLEASLQQLDDESLEANKYIVEEVLSASKQIVAGHKFKIGAKIATSDCPRTDSRKRYECKVLSNGQSKLCKFEIYEALWIPNSRKITIECENPKSRRTSYSNVFRNEEELTKMEFKNFIKKYKKKYSNTDYEYRFRVFSSNLRKIELLNTHEQGTATYSVNQFADMTQSEFSKSRGLRMDLKNENEATFPLAPTPEIELPTEFDWRSKGVVTEVKNQKECGSCWAFSVTGNVEGQYALKHGTLLEFSEQELVDCDTEDQGCNGGLMDTAYREIEKLGGLETEQDYPYDAEDEKCHFNKTLARVQLSGALNISQDESEMAKWLVANGPISIAINANAMQFYMGGVSHPYKFLCDPKSLDHGVLIVGYGVHTYALFNKTLPYWIVKNSWGTSWGEQGYYRVYRGDGTCGVNQTPSSAIVV